MSSRFDLLILDLDGTLVDSEALLVGLVNDTLAAHGYPRAVARAIGASIGLPLVEVFRRAAPGANADQIDMLCRAYRLHADTPEFVGQFTLCAGVKLTLAALRTKGVRMVIATSKRRGTTLDILRHCAIDHHLDAVIGGDCVAQGKPHPEMVHRARAIFPALPARTLVVGDTRFDMEMGHAAGVATCAVTYGVHPADELRAVRPDFMIDVFETLGDVVFGAARGQNAEPGQQTC